MTNHPSKGYCQGHNPFFSFNTRNHISGISKARVVKFYIAGRIYQMLPCDCSTISVIFVRFWWYCSRVLFASKVAPSIQIADYVFLKVFVYFDDTALFINCGFCPVWAWCNLSVLMNTNWLTCRSSNYHVQQWITMCFVIVLYVNWHFFS